MSAEPVYSDHQVRERALAVVRGRALNLVGTVVELRGDGCLSDEATEHPRELVEGQRVARGMKLRVEHGHALVRLDDGSDVWLAAGSVLDLSEWKPESRTLRLPLGRILALVAEQAARPFRLLAPAGEVCVTGTAFEVSAGEEQLRVQVLHGSVRVESGGHSLAVKRSAGVEVLRGAAPLPVKRRSWESAFADVSASRSNPHVAAALAAAEAAIDVARRSSSTSKKKEGRSMKKTALVVAVIVAAGFSMWGVARRYDGHEVEAHGALPAFGMAPGPGGMGRAAKIALKTPQGEEIVIDGSSPERLEESMAALTPAQRKAIGEIKLREAGPGQMAAPPGMSAEQHAIVTREMDAGMQAVRQMIKSGMSPEEASKAVGKGLEESINKQLEAQGKPPVRVIIDAKGDTERIGVMIAGPNEETGP